MGILGGRQHITVNGVDLADFGVYISGSGVYNAPERDVKSVSVPGRNGDLTLDNGRYKNVKIKYPAFIAENFAQNVDALRAFLASVTGYVRLEDTYHPEEYRMGRVSGAFTVKPEDKLRGGNFDLTFDCMPQRWLKSGEDRLPRMFVSGGNTTTVNILNPTNQIAKPLLRCSVNDSMIININNVQMKLYQNNQTGDTVIDCDLQEAYNANTGASRNNLLELTNGVFPSLNDGVNMISITALREGSVYSCTMYVTPRWWQI